MPSRLLSCWTYCPQYTRPGCGLFGFFSEKLKLSTAFSRPSTSVVGVRERDHVAPFFTLPDPEEFHAGRRLLERLVVANDVGVIREVAGFAGHVAEELQRRRHRGRHRHVIDELGDDARIGRRLLD